MTLIAGAEIHVAFRYTYLGQRCENVQAYVAAGLTTTGATMENWLEALWNDYKVRLRAFAPNDPAIGTFDSLVGTEIGGGLNFAEFPIPTLERVGERVVVDGARWLSGLNAGGFRQTVATRLTRPGQKRFPWVLDTQAQNNSLGADYLALLTDVATAFSTPSILGAPVVDANPIPIVVHEPGVRDPVRRTQAITGFVVNPDLTSQVSRKKGHGS